MTAENSGRRLEQAGAIVHRRHDGRVEVLLVTSRDGRDWIFPKGHVESGECAIATALREAHEETGILGVAHGVIEPPLEFRSGNEDVSVRYVLIRFLSQVASAEARGQLWLTLDEAREKLTHDDARRLLRQVEGELQSGEDDGRFYELLLADHGHVSSEFRANEDGGEKRVNFLVAIVTAVGGMAAFLVEKGVVWIEVDRVHPVIYALLALLLLFAHLTYLRVIRRNTETDKNKKQLDRIRRYFLSGKDDSRILSMPYDPFTAVELRKPRIFSLERGGWLQGVMLIESLLIGAMLGLALIGASWAFRALVGALASLAAWTGLVLIARNRYAAAKRGLREDHDECVRREQTRMETGPRVMP